MNAPEWDEVNSTVFTVKLINLIDLDRNVEVNQFLNLINTNVKLGE